MRPLHVGRGITWPAAIASQAIGVLGMRGAGKSNFGRVVAEELFASSIPFVIFDPIGNWYGIRAGRDGKPGGGIPVPIFGGEHGDLQLDRASGQRIADLVLDRHLSCVLDLSHADFSETDKRKFLVDFGERLFRRKSRESGWLTLIMEEADDYAPQSVHGGEKEGSTAKTLGMFQRLVKRGRFKGLGAVMITQRSAAINKDLLYMVGTLVVFRSTGPRDQEAVGGWVKYNAIGEKVLESLPTLENGEAWVIAPEALGSIGRVKVRAMTTYDTGATPEHGGQAKPATLADIDIPALTKELDEAVERAKAEDPRELRRRIADLEKQASQAKAEAGRKVAGQGIPILKDAQVKRLEAAVGRMRDGSASLLKVQAHQLDQLSQRMQVVVNEAGSLADQIKAAIAAVRATRPAGTDVGQAGSVHRAPEAVGVGRPAALSRPAPVVPSRAASGSVLGNSGLRRILTALAQRPQGLSAGQIGVRAGLSSKSGTFDTYLSRARASGWVVGDRGRLQITDAGLEALGHYDPLPTGQGLLQHWLTELGASGAARMLRALAEAYPRALAREELGPAAGLTGTSGTFDTYVSRLRSLELIEGRGELRASAELFE